VKKILRKIDARTQLFLVGFVVPGLVVLTCWILLLNTVLSSLFKRQNSDQFRKAFLNETLKEPIPDPQVVFLGDSSAKSGMSPRSLVGLSSVNLSINKGNAITAYLTMEEYLLRRSPPRCVVLISQFNWEHSYKDFFNIGVKERLFSIPELFKIAKIGYRENFFPADTHSSFSFWLNTFLYLMQLAEPPFADIQQAIWGGERTWNPQRPLGFWALPNTIIPEEEFFSTDFHPQLLQPFMPNKSENFYLLKLAQLAERHRFTLYVSSLPIAESDYTEPSIPFRQLRRHYVHLLFARKPNVEVFDLPPVAPRKLFYDFSHANDQGARLFTSWVQHRIKDHCSLTYRPTGQKRGYTKGDRTGANAKNAKNKANTNNANTMINATDTF
jgi:hypothetical protein